MIRVDDDQLLSVRHPEQVGDFRDEPSGHALTGIWRSEVDMSKIRHNSIFRKAGPLEETWIERHQNWTDCKCDVIVKKGFVTYICVKCGREI